MSKNRNLENNSNKRAALASSACLLFAVSSPTLVAQEVNAAITKKPVESDVEVIEVQGVRGALESALNTKREASSIVDAISATDIDALPALDFGEALQALPGVQLDRSNEGRTSEISLRGLSGGFIKTTAFGQSFATPSRSAGPTGGSNPFSAFEAGVFDGVTLVKTPTADMQAGGMAGVVDKQLQRALAKKDGKYSVSVGGRLEELTNNWDKSIKFSASKHLIENELAVAFKLSASEQTFRRDLVQFTQYTSLDDSTNLGPVSQNIDAYKAKYGLDSDADVRAIASGRNVSEYSEGDRFSFTGNIEWQPIDSLKVGTHLLYTKRDLDEGTKEDTNFSAGLHPTRDDRHQYHAGLEPDMDTAPFQYDTDESGNPIYLVSSSEFTNGAWQVTNRKTTFFEEAKGAMLYADYMVDDWAFDGVVSYSKSENQFLNVGLDFRHMEHHNASLTHRPAVGSAIPVDSVATGINGTLNTGQGTMGAMEISATGWDDYNYNNLNWSQPNHSSASVTSMDPSNNGRRVGHYVDGRVDNPTREMKSAEFNAERYVEFGFGNKLNFNTVQFGVRSSVEILENRDQKIGAPGINEQNIDNNFFSNDIITEGQTAFFNGNIPGTFGVNSGWLTLDTPYVNSRLQDGMDDLTQVTEDNDYALTFADPSGYYDRLNNGTKLPQLYANNFTIDQTINAAYFMTKFDGELGLVSYTGNFGVRYEETINDSVGKKRDEVAKTVEDFKFESSYSNTLPSLNVAFEIGDDFVIRSSYFKALVRPNLRAQNPSLSINENNSSIGITLPKSGLKPYTADNYDLSIEWYNREGSAISLGVFQKEITGLFLQEKSCPNPGEYSFIDAQFGAFEGENSELPGNCTQVNAFTNPDTGEVTNRSVTVTRQYNSNDEIHLKGVEFAVQQKLDFLPYPWNGLGGVFNYTYIDQETYEQGAEGSGIVENTDSKLYNVSPRSYNIIGYWENDGVSVRLAYNWRDSFEIKYPGGSYYGTEDRTTKASGRLDLAASYNIAKGLKLNLKAYNLSDEQTYEYFGNDERAVARLDYTGRIVALSMNYSF
ncbi:TonB-dependent receptor [Psychrosphaera sp. B3R10]|uniref:TonB-dependent receptor n=1 Tax=unclassified Psychrosphaera TaxID=2641570 RepID=UPI001C09D3DA|nr:MULTISPECIES: TonB-dependent receptor [unclassified Psychrosphaera]MBU2883514.1 TonB-dependent receptor [Psychrosphaera sp. I2R16]MBU2989693.1 TonB-dependent receptor [Psychrosphaera sp. B3R10]MDO6719853.1 TonB-dependent receptor [Psychrosphaera sp. 1_MG-2023]